MRAVWIVLHHGIDQRVRVEENLNGHWPLPDQKQIRGAKDVGVCGGEQARDVYKVERAGWVLEPRLYNEFGAGGGDGLHSGAIRLGVSDETRFPASHRSEVEDYADCRRSCVGAISFHSREYLDRSLAENQVSLDTITRARAPGRNMVFGLCNLRHRTGGPSCVRDPGNPRPSTSGLDKDRGWDFGACCHAAERSMVPCNQWIACNTPAATVKQDAHSHADMESQRFADKRI